MALGALVFSEDNTKIGRSSSQNQSERSVDESD